MPNSASASKPTTPTPVKAQIKRGNAAATPANPAANPAAKRKVPTKKISAKVASKPAKSVKPTKPAAPKKPKLVRDSFTLPQVDHDLIKQCKKTALAAGRETKKSEVLRAAIQSFAALSPAQQMAAYAKLQAIAVGRPKAK
jgi:hypothetical protein